VDIKQIFNRIKNAWQTGKIQQTSRITYEVFWNVILLLFVICLIGLFFAGGIGAGYFASLVKDEDIRSHEEMEKDIYNYEETSKLYFDNDEYLDDIRSDLHREEVSLDNVSDTLIDAVIATEDQYFMDHNGVVTKAIVRALFQEATNAETKTGGSTLTQQLIKNQMLTNEVSFDRKAKEILLALRLERFFSKDEILEAYLNVIPYGRNSSGENIAGIQTAAKGIFDVDANDLNLPQSAYLAGLPQSPSAYTPFLNTGDLKDEEDLKLGLKRMKYVLKRMYDKDFITQEEYEEALAYDITDDFTKKEETTHKKYPLLVNELESRAINILTKLLAQEDGYTLEDLDEDQELKKHYAMLAERDLRMNGYHIHSTIDKDIYDTMHEKALNFEHYGPKQKNPNGDEEPVQGAGILIENNSGRIISFFGSSQKFKNEINENNRATNAYRQNGSTMKAILSYPAAIEAGKIQPGTPIADIPHKYPDGKELTNYGGGYHGLVPARKAFADSYNIPAVKAYMSVLSDEPAKQYLRDMQFKKLTEEDFVNPSLALGSMSEGVSVEENVSAFAMLGNNGQFVEPYMIEKITDKDGEVIYEHERDEVDIYSQETTYLTIDMMRDVIKNGTGQFLSSQLKHNHVDWAGKTGTTDDYKDAWFVGTNPNVTFGTWIGYDSNMSLDYCPGCSLSYSQRNQKLWAEIMNSISDIDAELLAPEERFKRPDGIVEQSYCATSGMKPSELCKKAGLVETDLFNEKFTPDEEDDSLISGSYVNVGDKDVEADSDTPEEFVDGDGLMFNPEFLKRHDYDKLSDLSILFPNTNKEAWEKISIPSGDLEDPIEENGDAPDSPSDLSVSDSTLSWSKANSDYVIGYYIYRASNSKKDFKMIDHTTDTSYELTDEGVYYVTSVDYFGEESKASGELTFGDDEEEKDDNDDDKEEEDKDEDEHEDED